MKKTGVLAHTPGCALDGGGTKRARSHAQEGSQLEIPRSRREIPQGLPPGIFSPLLPLGTSLNFTLNFFSMESQEHQDSSTPKGFKVGDGATDDTAAFRSAWKAACQVNNGTLWCLPTLLLSSLLQFFLDLASQASFSRTGTIEGNGQKWWDLPCKPHRLIRFFMSSNLVVSGLRIQNSPQFHMKFDGCQGILINDLSISSPKLSPNTDGIHIENTKSVGIYNSVIANGDDCISIGTGCSDVDIEGVTCGPSHGISIGSLGPHNSHACVSNITVRNAFIKESDNGLRIKTWQGGTGSVTGISFENIQMENVRNCVIIDQYYCLTKACRNETSAVYLTDVTYKNIKGSYDVRSPPIHFACSDTVPCTNITMSEVELLPYEGVLVDDPFCWNAYGMQQTLTIPPIDCLQDGMPQSIAENPLYTCSYLPTT
ncbi:hypothetical protein DH2020_004324 [Rehmannia glutinosa]|uniref:Polygalacturonase n=1 Tax=Rehmannia glutinosa TaxID=99300 RepID=A0ABR0XP84_REHGL